MKLIKSIFEKVVYVIVQINKCVALNFIEAYALTTCSEDEEAETFDEEISKGLRKNKTTYVIVGLEQCNRQ